MVTASRTTTAPVRTLPGRYYYDQGIFELEQERIFSRNWVHVGRADSIPEAGDFFLAPVGAESVIVLRDRKGEV
ncbi:MAG: Rieske (2Fe-2S) domain protein, partial [Chloroflexi bacterium]|nr:Rieske (2Fe-2S) domain protein [Chloroflexota bacterium]